MSGSGAGFGLPITIAGLTDVNQNLIAIQRSLSALFQSLSAVSVLGPAGPPGSPGANGANGLSITSGTGAPAGSPAVGTLYIDTVTGNLWRFN